MTYNITDREKIAMGECVSPLTVERCPYCIDTCDAAHFAREVKKLKSVSESNNPNQSKE